MFTSFTGMFPGNPVIIGMHLPTEGIRKDVQGALKEVIGIETPAVAFTRQAMVALADGLYKVNPTALWLHIAHSRAGATGTTAIMGMTLDEQKLIKEHMLWMGVGPALPLPSKMAFRATNVYSKQDFVTGVFGVLHKKPLFFPSENKDYNIQFLPCSSTWSERTGFADHGIMGSTYLRSIEKNIYNVENEFGFYKTNR